MAESKKITLRIPPQDLQAFTLFPANTEGARNWAQALPVANTNAVVESLEKALSELNRSPLPPEARFGILEALIPSLDVALSSLAKRFRNQPLVMAAEPQKMADLSNKLHSMARTAYTIVAIEAIRNRESIRGINPARLTCESLQRALTYAGGQVLQTLRIFRPMHAQGWHTLHQLYTVAESQQLTDLPVPAPRNGGSTIKSTYLRAVLLACCKPHHLRQGEHTAIWQGLQEWSENVELKRDDDKDTLYVIDLDSDQPPIYLSLYRKEPDTYCRYLDTRKLLTHLQELKVSTGTDGVRLSSDVHLDSNLLDHVITALGTMRIRNFNRTECDNELQICIGLTSTHYHVGGRRTFAQLLRAKNMPQALDRPSNNPFIPPTTKADIWQKANPREFFHDDKVIDETDDEKKHHADPLPYRATGLAGDLDPDLRANKEHPVYKVKLADTSSGGYCLEWNDTMPADINAGDIIGLKEQDDAQWAIAVIRWLGQLDDARTLVGLELLSPQAMPFGASIHKKNGEKSAPLRVLLLPQIKLVGQPHTLITPRAGFKEHQKVTIGNSEQKCAIRLTRLVAATGSFAQFEYCYVKELGDLLAGNGEVKLRVDPDSLWNNM